MSLAEVRFSVLVSGVKYCSETVYKTKIEAYNAVALKALVGLGVDVAQLPP